LHKKLQARKILIFSMILLVLTFFVPLPVPKVSAEVSINQLSPTKGPVGTVVSVSGQISTPNGTYKIFFNNKEVENGTATDYDVSDTFVVQNQTYGSYPVKLNDVNTKENSTDYFTVQTDYIVKAVTPPYPKQLQEGSNITIRAIVTGGNVTTFANITVTDPASTTHSALNISIPVFQDGYGEANVAYLTDFDGNPHTFYVGTYNMSLTALSKTAAGNFTIGLTDAVEYHRFQTVYVQALNYTSNDVLKIKITYNDKIVFESAPNNASGPKGIIAANWTIPANASLGLYRVDVTPTGKPVPENQTFTIVSKSFSCEVKTVNLKNEPLEGIVVEANNTTTLNVSTNTTTKDGLTSFYLEATNYTFTAFFNNKQVSNTTAEIRLNGTVALNISCSLAHITIAVKDTEGNLLPFVSVSANFTYMTRTDSITTSAVSTETNLTGIATFRNLFTNINYTIEASRYDYTFSTTTTNFTSAIWFDWFNITCPTREFTIKVFDRNSVPLEDAVVNVYDWGIGLNGLVGTGNTGAIGEITFNSTFGKYTVRVYKVGMLLNETTILLIDQPTTLAVYCKLYRLTLSVNVLDYFGQGVSNANVTIEREGIVISSLNTGGDGFAQFTGLIGGNYKIFVYIAEKPYKITTIYLQEPKTVALKIEEIVSIGSFITETGYFITAIFILLIVVVFLLAFIYRRIRSRQKAE